MPASSATEKTLTFILTEEFLDFFLQVCPLDTGVPDFSKPVSPDRFSEILDLVQSINLVLAQKHSERKPLKDFLLANKERLDNYLQTTTTSFAPPVDPRMGDTSLSTFAVREAQKLLYEKSLKYVTLSFSGGKEAKLSLKSFLKQCDVASRICKDGDLPLLQLGMISKIQGEPQLFIEDQGLDTWNAIVRALKEKYGEPETFSQRLYIFLTQAHIKKTESSAEYGERVNSLLSQVLESLQDEQTIKSFTVSQFLQHLAKVFYIERGNPNIVQYLRLYYKDLSTDFSRVTEAKAEEQKIKGYGCLLYTSPSPRDRTRSRMPSSA